MRIKDNQVSIPTDSCVVTTIVGFIAGAVNTYAAGAACCPIAKEYVRTPLVSSLTLTGVVLHPVKRLRQAYFPGGR